MAAPPLPVDDARTVPTAERDDAGAAARRPRLDLPPPAAADAVAGSAALVSGAGLLAGGSAAAAGALVTASVVDDSGVATLAGAAAAGESSLDSSGGEGVGVAGEGSAATALVGVSAAEPTLGPGLDRALLRVREVRLAMAQTGRWGLVRIQGEMRVGSVNHPVPRSR